MTVDLAFFGLREAAFDPTPNPRFLHLTPAHQEALAQLLYGIQHRKGFILLTGDIGTGKTTLLQALLERLDESIAVAFVTNSLLGFDGILEYMLEDLGINKAGEDTSAARRLFALQNFLVERQRAGQNTVLILDEAQDLDPHTLEQIRLLSNFETKSQKILQIVLVGQPELRSKLDLPELRQLKQRIGLRFRVPRLDPEQVRGYIRTRLRVAGATDLGLFSQDAVARIAAYSEGIPRLINTVCDHCLVFAYADQVRRITGRIVDDAIQYLEDGDGDARNEGRLRRGWRMTPLRWSLLATSAGIGGLSLLDRAAPGGRSMGDWSGSVFRLSSGPICTGIAPAMSKFFKALEQANRDRVATAGAPGGCHRPSRGSAAGAGERGGCRRPPEGRLSDSAAPGDRPDRRRGRASREPHHARHLRSRAVPGASSRDRTTAPDDEHAGRGGVEPVRR